MCGQCWKALRRADNIVGSLKNIKHWLGSTPHSWSEREIRQSLVSPQILRGPTDRLQLRSTGGADGAPGRSTALPSPAYCFASVIVWTENKNITIFDRFICFILTVKRRWRCIRVTWLEDFLTSKWPGSFTVLAPPVRHWTSTALVTSSRLKWTL